MKPQLLEMQAFGPFAQRQVIDFRVLGDKTFFLIHGPTGSGKTSILDGLCFALFGDSSGGEREGRQMRSHHADGDTLTEVGFEFTLGSERYRVRRVPEQMRKAKRGGGETRQLPVAELWRLEAQPDDTDLTHPIASGWAKVTEAVVKLLGFESQQFRQVIILPQGKFFEFLKSNSQEREKILQTLFGTAFYKRIEEQLKQAANDLSRQADQVRLQRQALLDQAQAADEPTLQARHAQQVEALATRRTEEQAATTVAQASEQHLAEAGRVADRFTELDEAGAALQALRAREPAVQAQRTQLACARQAASLHPYAIALDEQARLLEDERRRSLTLANDLVAATAQRQTTEAALNAQREQQPEAEHLIARIAELDALADKVALLARTRAEHDQSQRQAAQSAEALTQARQALQTATQSLQTLETQRQEHQLQAAELEGLKQLQARLAAQRAQLDRLDTSVEAQAQAARQAETQQVGLQASEAGVATLRTQRDALRQQWVAGQAARLARELVAGQACPVCGGADHPTPAQTQGELVLDSTLQAAEDALSQAENARRAAEQQLGQTTQRAQVLQAQIAEIRATLGDVAQPAQLKEQATATQARLQQAEAAAQALQTLEARRTEAGQALARAQAALTQAETAAQAAQAQHQHKAGQLNERESGIPQDLRAPAALQAVQTQAKARRQALQQAFDAATAAANQANARWTEVKAQTQSADQVLDRLTTQHAAKSKDFDERLRAAGFAHLGPYREASLTESAIQALDTELRAFDMALASGTERQARATQGTADLVRPDMPALRTRHEAVQAAQRAASNAVRDAVAALDHTVRLAESLQKLGTEFQALEARYTVLKQVADVAGGTNAQRMSFQRYVLATLLEEVLAATSLRLRVMSSARYEMRRKLQPVDQRAAAGLDLEVFDQYTGTLRPVHTLSGGESFLASLALALGLSDVVQSHAGGIRLDAIFVDEGFGTLDPESLDFAIRALKDLQQAGRMVGIISHAAELREWIDARLELKATASGSRAAFVS